MELILADGCRSSSWWGTMATSSELRNALFTADPKKADKLEMGHCHIRSKPAPSDMFRTTRLHLLIFPKQLLQLETQVSNAPACGGQSCSSHYRHR